MPGAIRKLLEDKFQLRTPALYGVVTNAPIGSDGRPLGYVIAQVAGQYGIKVLIDPDSPGLAPGDSIEVAAQGTPGDTVYYFNRRASGTRPQSGMFQFMSDVSVAGSSYSAGDILIGDLIGGANTWINSTGIHIRNGVTDLITLDASNAGSPFVRVGNNQTGSPYTKVTNSAITMVDATGAQVLAANADGSGSMGKGYFTWTPTVAKIGGWTLGASSLTGGTGASTVAFDIAAANPTIYAGNATPANAPFRVYRDGTFVATAATITGSISAVSGCIGGWTIGPCALTGGTGASTVGMDIATSHPAFYAGGADESAPFRVWRDGRLYASSASIAGDVNATSGCIGSLVVTGSIRVGPTTGYVVIDGVGGSVGSNDFTTGNKGWQLGANGNAEFNNITARGVLKTALFQKNAISAVGGNLMIIEADVLSASVGAADTTIYTSGSITFTASDFVRFKDGTNDEWMQINTTASAPSAYTVVRDLAAAYGTDPTWSKGMAFVNYGQNGEGGILQTSGSNPYISIFTRGASPWLSVTENARLGNMIGVYGAVGSPFGFGAGNYSASEYISYDPTNGFIVRGASGGFGISSSGMQIVSGLSYTTQRSITFNNLDWATGSARLTARMYTVPDAGDWGTAISRFYIESKASSSAASNKSEIWLQALDYSNNMLNYLKIENNTTTAGIDFYVGGSAYVTGSVAIGGGLSITGSTATLSSASIGVNLSVTGSTRSNSYNVNGVQGGIYVPISKSVLVNGTSYSSTTASSVKYVIANSVVPATALAVSVQLSGVMAVMNANNYFGLGSASTGVNTTNLAIYPKVASYYETTLGAVNCTNLSSSATIYATYLTSGCNITCYINIFGYYI
jgi:hypothetical protein